MKLELFYIFVLLLATIYRSQAIDQGEILDKIRKAPAWSIMTQDDIDVKGPKLLDAMSDVPKLSPHEVRTLELKLLSDLSSSSLFVDRLHAWSKIYILNRFYFAIPSGDKNLNLKRFGGWIFYPNTKSAYVLWPLKEMKNGGVALIGTSYGYEGAPYDGIGEFDYFQRKYPIR